MVVKWFVDKSSRIYREINSGEVEAAGVRRSIRHELSPTVDTTLMENIGIQVILNVVTTINVYSCYFAGGTFKVF